MKLAAVTYLVLVSALAAAQTETVLYGFTGAPDGDGPIGVLVRDDYGNLYGTTYRGGDTSCAQGCGTVFVVNPSGKETVLYRFVGGNDGATPAPYGGLARDPQGNLYGTTALGGPYNVGTVFKVTPTGIESVLHAFTGGVDGGTPDSGLIHDGQGNLYGTTSVGGAFNAGTVFKIAPSGLETVLYSFSGGGDGGLPYASLILDTEGNLYGTTAFGGAANLGTVFQLTPTGAENVLHSFIGGADGANPYSAGLLRDERGNLYGATYFGGAGTVGTIFRVTSTGAENVLHSFSGTAGEFPFGGLVRDAKNNLYGTTELGGAYGYGTVFELTARGRETVLYSFTGYKDGAYPFGGVVRDAKGNLYGTSSGGGPVGRGLVFKIAP
jgi:uncharacterized repeat protein (TIGR03803 family)